MRIHQYNLPCKQTERKKNPHSHFIRPLDTEKKQKQTIFHVGEIQDTSLGEVRDTRCIPKHNKGNIEQGNSQHQIKWREA